LTKRKRKRKRKRNGGSGKGRRKKEKEKEKLEGFRAGKIYMVTKALYIDLP
jgi:hypothetical protein